jgi:hypothetical protein
VPGPPGLGYPLAGWVQAPGVRGAVWERRYVTMITVSNT